MTGCEPPKRDGGGSDRVRLSFAGNGEGAGTGGRAGELPGPGCTRRGEAGCTSACGVCE